MAHASPLSLPTNSTIPPTQSDLQAQPDHKDVPNHSLALTGLQQQQSSVRTGTAAAAASAPATSSSSAEAFPPSHATLGTQHAHSMQMGFDQTALQASSAAPVISSSDSKQDSATSSSSASISPHNVDAVQTGTFSSSSSSSSRSAQPPDVAALAASVQAPIESPPFSSSFTTMEVRFDLAKVLTRLSEGKLMEADQQFARLPKVQQSALCLLREEGILGPCEPLFASIMRIRHFKTDRFFHLSLSLWDSSVTNAILAKMEGFGQARAPNLPLCRRVFRRWTTLHLVAPSHYSGFGLDAKLAIALDVLRKKGCHVKPFRVTLNDASLSVPSHMVSDVTAAIAAADAAQASAAARTSISRRVVKRNFCPICGQLHRAQGQHCSNPRLCSRCNQPGHAKRACKVEPASFAPCPCCGKAGHGFGTCFASFSLVPVLFAGGEQQSARASSRRFRLLCPLRLLRVQQLPREALVARAVRVAPLAVVLLLLLLLFLLLLLLFLLFLLLFLLQLLLLLRVWLLFLPLPLLLLLLLFPCCCC